MDPSIIIVGILNMLMPLLINSFKSVKAKADLKRAVPALQAAIAVLQNLVDSILNRATGRSTKIAWKKIVLK